MSEKFKIHSVETVSEVNPKSNVKIMTRKTKKSDKKAIEKKESA